MGFFHLGKCIYDSSMSFHGLTAHFLVLNNILLFGWVIVYFSITKGYLGCFQVLAVMKKAAIYICVQVFVWV